MNLPVARQLYDYCAQHKVNALELEGWPISFSVGPKLQAWSPALFVYPDRITIPFVDPRKGKRLTREGIRFIFSIQFHAVRVNNPDYDEVHGEIIQFSKEDGRSIRIIPEDGMRLFSYEELEFMISQTQRMWFDVLTDRQQETRRRAGGTGSLI
ncbi:hypothetical protein H7F51_16195 [Novosphingobium flavum]|uniref:Uncharacterized protein n=2 Tax=Novosphingobium flavum TaxID=1778672 RepID=A0A7X1FU63_9SPHN|nr:hypothetical protein [Novosphingobium flavum]MBC2667060.1 hypothetical protein [Novosphingobium flavum]